MMMSVSRLCGIGPILGVLLTIPCLLPPATFAQPPTVCLQCHGAQPGKGGAPVKQWQGSIHAESGISCHDCHGGDPKDAANAMSPARGFLGAPQETAVPPFCGRCHVGILEDYLKSAHGRALGKGGPTCVTCHGDHGVKRATLELINNKSCSRCHPYKRAGEIKAAMRQTEGMIAAIEGRITRFKGEGVNTESREKRLFALRNHYHRLFHEIDTAKVKEESVRIQSELDTISRSLDSLDAQKYRRKIAGAVVVAALLAAALLLHLLKGTFKNSELP